MIESIAEIVLRHAQRQPERPALFFEEQTISYGQLAKEAIRFMRALMAWGLQPGDRVALFLDNCPAFVVSYLGTHLARGIVVLVNTQYRQVELSHILNDAGVRLCVTSAAGAEALRGIAVPTLTTLVLTGEREVGPASEGIGCIAFTDFMVDANDLHGLTGEPRAGQPGTGEPRTGQPQGIAPTMEDGSACEGASYHCSLRGEPRAGEPRTGQPQGIAPTMEDGSAYAWLPCGAAMPGAEDPAVIGYTSGTTGRAKGALLIHRNLTANVAAVTAAWHWTDRDCLLLTLPLFHAHGLMVGLHGTLFSGASVVLRQKFDAADVCSILHKDAGITLFFGVPTMYARLLTEAERQGVPAHLPRLFVSGSAPLSPQLFNDFARVFGQSILERYGMTETIMNLTNPYEGERRAGTVGGPFPGQQARVVDVRTRLPLAAGEIGEIEVRGPHVFVGYWQRPDATAEAFSCDGWFKTGDLGWCSSDGYYTITGRARELIISGGYNIYPREVEDVLETHPAIAEVAVLGLPDSEMGEQVVAVVVPRQGHAPTAHELIVFCREQLASYKKPRRVVFVDTLPRNALGKIQKHLLVAQLSSW